MREGSRYGTGCAPARSRRYALRIPCPEREQPTNARRGRFGAHRKAASRARRACPGPLCRRSRWARRPCAQASALPSGRPRRARSSSKARHGTGITPTYPAGVRLGAFVLRARGIESCCQRSRQTRPLCHRRRHRHRLSRRDRDRERFAAALEAWHPEVRKGRAAARCVTRHAHSSNPLLATRAAFAGWPERLHAPPGHRQGGAISAQCGVRRRPGRHIITMTHPRHQ